MEQTLTPKDAGDAIELMLTIKQPTCIWGQPGIGKSQIVQQTAAALSLECLDVRAVLLDPVDLRGLPHVNGDGMAHWAQPSFLPREGKGVVFLDELNRAPTMVQNACFQLILDRKLGEYILPEGWSIIAACNRETDGGGITRMPQALANRFEHINLVPDITDWCAWALSHNIHPLVLTFLRNFRADLLHQYSKDQHAFPSPRSWEVASRIIHAAPNQKLELALLGGAVGQEAAIEFLSFVGLYRQLPNVDAILLNPTTAPVPDNVSTLYAVSSTLAHRATPTNLSRVIQYLDRLPQEYAMFCIKDAVVRTPALTSTPEFTNWAVRMDVLL